MNFSVFKTDIAGVLNKISITFQLLLVNGEMPFSSFKNGGDYEY